MSDHYAYEADARHEARRVRREAEADRRAYEMRVYLRRRRRATVTTAAGRLVHAIERLIGHLTRKPTVAISRDSVGS